MKQIKILFCLVIVCSIIISSCKKDAPANIDIGYNYFPIKEGAYIIYDVDSTYYDDFFTPSKVVNTKYQLKETIKSLFNDDQNRVTARLERSIKKYDPQIPYSEMEWVLKNVWVENVLKTTAEKVEENTRYVRLIFPVIKNKTWNVNSKNNETPKDITYKAVGFAEKIGTIAFDSLAQTVYDDGGTILTSRNYETEKYAKNVGLVYKQVIDVRSQPSPESTTTELQTFYSKPLMERITSGIQYTWIVNSYGTE